ncbi:class D beta-lactamase [Synechocystis salina LEGE 00031]|uniref:beta-lactamase n=2 Tax=Synechocystis TaxID=1142 RepID=A0ABR9VM80_9SYNC|nr:class D beta-lactamase [Synechocystis salina LEGE 00041]MBE9252447.1 class D beta-lactamase [Synechocystis salina LEGE 00031]
MNQIIYLANFVTAFLTCMSLILWEKNPSLASQLNMTINTKNPIYLAKNIDCGKHFRDLGVQGSILVVDQENKQILAHNPQRNETYFPVASTFKILNSLIAVESGVIQDEISVLTWDGIERELPQWNRDLNLREAFKISAVWFYQVLARRVGHARMEAWITKVGYGNQQIGTEENIDQFWLNGTLQATPQEQIQLLRRLHGNQLPFSERTVAIVKDIMITEKTPEYIIRAKTGWFGFGDYSRPNIGWYFGYVEKEDNVYFFATNIDIHAENDGPARLQLTRRCLTDLAIL